MRFNLPPESTGLRLCKMRGEELILCEAVTFTDGVGAVDMILRRASVSGKVGPVGEAGDFWADVMTDNGDTLVETVALDRAAWNALKNHWMRCRIEKS